MFHLDNNSGVSSMPAIGAMQDNTTRWFTEGAGNQAPSWPGQDWFNIVQSELLNVLTEGGISPAKTQLNQLAVAIKAIVNKNALMRDNLLSEIKDKGASAQKIALDNLNGVPKTTTVNGHSLTGNVNVTSQDIFNLQAVLIPASADLNSYTIPGIYYQPANASAASGKNYPSVSAGSLLVLKDASVTQIYTEYSSSNNNSPRQYRRGNYGGNWTAWSRVYDERNKPTPAELGVLPTAGGTMSGQLNVATVGQGSWTSQYNSGAPVMQTYAFQETSSHYFPAVKQKIMISSGPKPYSYAVSTGVTTSTTEQISWNVQILGSGGQSYIMSFRAENGGRLTVPEQVIPGNYGNFDSRYQAKGSYGKPNSASKSTNGWWKCGDTGIIKQWGIVSVGDNSVVTANFPIPFPNGCKSLVVSARSQAANSANDVLSAYGIAISNSQMRVALCADWDNHGASGAYFEAIGY